VYVHSTNNIKKPHLLHSFGKLTHFQLKKISYFCFSFIFLIICRWKVLNFYAYVIFKRTYKIFKCYFSRNTCKQICLSKYLGKVSYEWIDFDGVFTGVVHTYWKIDIWIYQFNPGEVIRLFFLLSPAMPNPKDHMMIK